METLRKIGKYELHKELGRGATAVVYLARDPFRGIDVALKVFKTQGTSAAGGLADRLVRKFAVTEASLAGKLVHPHIVQILDAAIDANPPYVAMEYVAGGTLEPYCRPDNLLSVVDVVEIVFKCTRALDFAQQFGLVHRDLKPANILRTSGTDVKITDFGAAQAPMSGETVVLGVCSPHFASPQQFLRDSLNQQSDIYSLGVVMYCLLTGHRPFHGDEMASVVKQVICADPAPPSSLREGIPEEIDRIVAKAMHKELDARYLHWDEFSRDLIDVYRAEIARLKRSAPPPLECQRFGVLRDLKFFREFGDAELWEVLRASRWERFSEGAVMFEEGEKADRMWYVISGEVRAFKKRRLLNRMGIGECFGEIAMLCPDSNHRSATVVVSKNAILAAVDYESIRNFSDSCRHSFSEAFMQLLVKRLKTADARYVAS